MVIDSVTAHFGWLFARNEDAICHSGLGFASKHSDKTVSYLFVRMGVFYQCQFATATEYLTFAI